MDPALVDFDFAKAGAILADMVASYLAAGAPPFLARCDRRPPRSLYLRGSVHRQPAMSIGPRRARAQFSPTASASRAGLQLLGDQTLEQADIPEVKSLRATRRSSGLMSSPSSSSAYRLVMELTAQFSASESSSARSRRRCFTTLTVV